MDETDKRKVLSENFADMLGLDVSELAAAIEDDEFSRDVQEEGLATPYEKTSVGGLVAG